MSDFCGWHYEALETKVDHLVTEINRLAYDDTETFKRLDAELVAARKAVDEYRELHRDWFARWYP